MTSYIISNLKKQKLRSLLMIIGIGALVAMVISITGIVSYQLKSMELHSASNAGKIIVQPQYSKNEFPISTIDLAEEGFGEIWNLGEFQEYLSTPVLSFIIQPPEYPTGPPLKRSPFQVGPDPVC